MKNCKIRGSAHHQVQAAVICQERVEQSELESFLHYLRKISWAIMAQKMVLNEYGDLFRNAIKGLDMDLEENNNEIDRVQAVLRQFNNYKEN